MVAVIGRHVELKRPADLEGLLPVPRGAHPSFHVYVEDKHYKCYGCGEYGTFTFLQKLQARSSRGGARAGRRGVGIEIPESDAHEIAGRRSGGGRAHRAVGGQRRRGLLLARLGSRYGRRRAPTWCRAGWRRSR
ncbi:MAG: hypothetical protein IPO09_15400 [Anaeromyxobacter sp.]|nr:hypothetical protein [Anaeromyxobacter sp.]